ncbi:MAG: tRNA uridine-5-carboxymethylaminomethyl(34) synthesis GTPase MnmE [Clostridia bacterium]|nr:tRNA uridine-5-carboxymethylaminomethyl(34) synthesis GTPase MnmE [Clostridia bacterium]
MMQVFDTIAAVSTPRGKGGIAVIRISGPEAVAVGEKVFFPQNGRALSLAEHGRVLYGGIRTTESDGTTTEVDDGMCVVFRAPRSFTGEDTVEISCHGGMLVTETVLAAVFSAGARPAMAGEFTRRAFVSGRMSLSQAEALGVLLEATNARQLALAHAGVKGVLSDKIDVLYATLNETLSSIYARIDFPDEDLGHLDEAQILQSLTSLYEETVKLSDTYRTGRTVNAGIRTVICGRTNAGKSSLYNWILGREAAIVTDIEGTTRDLLEETVPFGAVTLRLCDTAGLRNTGDRVESIGVARAREAMQRAELIFAVFDGTRLPDEEDVVLIRELAGIEAAVIPLLNKSDLATDHAQAVWQKALADGGLSKALVISVRDESGMEALQDEINHRFTDGSLDLRYDAIVADARQYAALTKAGELLQSAADGLRSGFALDSACIDAEQAMQALGEINGRNVREDIVSEIFSKFCVGK